MIEAFVALLILVVVASATMAMRRAKLRRFAGRERLSDVQIIAMLSSSKATDEKAAWFLGAVARAAEVPMGLIRPEDRFDSELRPERGWEYGDEIAWLPSILASKFGGRPEQYDLSKNSTVAQLFREVVRDSDQEDNSSGNSR